METAISLFNQLPSTKIEIDSFCDKVKNTILAGNDNPLTISVQLKSIEEVVKKLRSDKDIQACIEDELCRNGNKVTWAGADIQLRNSVNYKYDYDAEWTNINEQINLLKAQLKAREEFLKRITAEVVDNATGEIIKPIPVESKTTIVVTLNK